MPRRKTLDFPSAKTAAFRLLKFRARSQKEIEDRLKKKGFSQDIIQKTVNYLKELKYINDYEFACAWIENRLAKPLGSRRIFFELQQKGVKESVAKEALDKIKDKYNEYDTVAQLAKNKFKRLSNLEESKAKQRVYNFLIRRGFDFDTVQEVINEL